MNNIKPNFNEIYTAYLSWNNPDKLQETLLTQKSIVHHTSPTFFFQACSNKDMLLAQKYPNANVLHSSKNIGIANAFCRLAKDAIYKQKKYFLFIENDMQVIEQANTVLKLLKTSMDVIDTGDADLIQLRHSQQPGEPLFCDVDRGRYDINNRRKLESRFWQNPAEVYPEHVHTKNIDGIAWFFTTSKQQNWTNNPYICSISLLKKILKILENEDLENVKKYSGLEDTLAGFMNWHRYEHKIAATNKGLFTHCGDRKRSG